MKYKLTYADGYTKTVEAKSAAEAYRYHRTYRTAETGMYTPLVSVEKV